MNGHIEKIWYTLIGIWKPFARWYTLGARKRDTWDLKKKTLITFSVFEKIQKTKSRKIFTFPFTYIRISGTIGVFEVPLSGLLRRGIFW